MDWECCWNRDVIGTGDCPNIGAAEADLLLSQRRRLLEKCYACPLFKKDLQSFNSSGHSIAPVMLMMHSEYMQQKTYIQSLVGFLDSKSLEVRFMHEIGSVLQSSLDLEEVLSVALTAITAGNGFGMNRAILLMTDDSRAYLQGFLAIGPRNLDEAHQTWNEIANNDMDLQTLAQSFRENRLSAERAKFHDLLEQLSVPLSDTNHLLIKSLDEKQPRLIENAFSNPQVPAELAQILAVDTFLLMPLVSRNRRVGLIIADNCITHRQITAADMQMLETFSFPVAFAIERSSLYNRLQVELNHVTAANKKLKEQQELIVKMEKMALVGKITSSIAHSIRNPLMIIGGFARSMLRSTNSNDPKRDFIESIVDEASQLEGVLDEILGYSDGLYPVKDFWDVGQLIEAAMNDSAEVLFANGYKSNFWIEPLLPQAYIDCKQISYCLRSILLNDISYGAANRVVNISAKLVAESIVIYIEDCGRQASQEDLDLILSPFYSTHKIGTGLGLGLCKTIQEKNGIPLEAKSLGDAGVLFSITLPTRMEEQHE